MTPHAERDRSEQAKFSRPLASIERSAAATVASELSPDTPVLVQVELRWAREVLAVRHVRAKKGLVRLGDLDLRAELGMELADESLVVARRASSAEGENRENAPAGSTSSSARTQSRLELVLPSGAAVPSGSAMTLRFGRASLRIFLTADDAAKAPRAPLDRRVWLGMAAAAALHVFVVAGLVGASAGSVPSSSASRDAHAPYVHRTLAPLPPEWRVTDEELREAALDPAGSAPPSEGAPSVALESPHVERTPSSGGEVARGEPSRAGASRVANFGMIALLSRDASTRHRTRPSRWSRAESRSRTFDTNVDFVGGATLELSGLGEPGGGFGGGVPLE